MPRLSDTFVFPPELGTRLRDLRLKAGLTQLELARAMGRTGRKAGNLVGRLERGDEPFPSLGLFADFLRGCRAGFKDVLDILDLYTNLPTPGQKVFGRELARIAGSVPQKWQAQVVDYDLQFEHPKPSAKPEAKRTMPDRLKRLERARKMAAAARRRHLYGQFLAVEVNKTELKPVMTVREALFNHGLEWFRILYRMRGSRPERREKRLAESEAEFAKASRFPLAAIRRLQDAVRRRFEEMERSGEISWLPDLSLDEYEAGLLAPARKRRLRQELHREFVRRLDEYDAARRVAVEQVWNEVQPALDEAGVLKERRPVYRGAVARFCSAAGQAEPGSAEEQRQVDEYILEPRWIRLGLDTALAQKLASSVLSRYRELAESLPPDPRPKR